MRRRWKGLAGMVLVVSVAAYLVVRAERSPEKDRTEASVTGDSGEATVPSSDGTTEEGPGKIVFVSNRDGQPDIYVMDPDGSNVRRVTNDPDREESPTWSPDGKQIAFASTPTDKPRSWQIFTVNADGTRRRQLTKGDEWSNSPAWSPDGAKIAFSRTRTIWAMNPDGTDARALPPLDPRFRRSDPAWSPDGREIIFSSDEGNLDPSLQRPWFEIWMTEADGSNPTRLPLPWHGSSLMLASPSWSPDGTTIAYLDSAWPYLASPGAPIARRLLPPAEPSPPTTGWSNISRPTWSPDGKKIAFSAKRVTYTADATSSRREVPAQVGDSEIWAVNADGSGLVNLTNNPAADRDPAWSPPGLASLSSRPPRPVVVPPQRRITREEAVAIAGRFAEAVGWKAEGEVNVDIEPRHSGSGRLAWEVSWFQRFSPGSRVPDVSPRELVRDASRRDIGQKSIQVDVDALTGQVFSGADYPNARATVQPLPQPPAVLPERKAMAAVTRYLEAAGLGGETRPKRVQGPIRFPDGYSRQYVIDCRRYFGDVEYIYDRMSLYLDAKSGGLLRMKTSGRIDPPRDAPRNISRERAVEIAKGYLPEVVGDHLVGEVKTVELKVVPPRGLARGWKHADEPSRIAWVLEYSHAGAGQPSTQPSKPTGHQERPPVDITAAEIWVDVEDGSLLGGGWCG